MQRANVPLIHRIISVIHSSMNLSFLKCHPVVDVSAKIIVLVTSTIKPGQAPLCYTDTRSVFSAGERFAQTLASIRSVQDKIPDAAIILLENSSLTSDETSLLQNCVTQVVSYSGDSEAVKWRDSPFKGAGELYMLIQALKWIRKLNYDRIFKLSGRYCLNARFELSSFPADTFGFYSVGTSFSTRLYSVPKSLECLYGLQLKKAFRESKQGNSIESFIMSGVPESKISRLSWLGVTGHIAVTGDYIIE